MVLGAVDGALSEGVDGGGGSDSHVSKIPLIYNLAVFFLVGNSPSGASRAVGDGGGARCDSHKLGAVDSGLLGGGLSNSGKGRGDEASSKDHGTHFGGFGFGFVWLNKGLLGVERPE